MGSVLPTSFAMLSSLLVRSAIVLVLARVSLQQSVPQATRAPLVPQWTAGGSGLPGYQGFGTGQGFGTVQGFGTGQGFRDQGTQGYRGVQGYPGGDGRYGFEIVDAPDRYGYVSSYPGGRTSFFLLGPNRGPGQQSWRGSAMGAMGGSQPGTYRPGTYRPGTFPSGTNTNTLGGGGWQQPGAW